MQLPIPQKHLTDCRMDAMKVKFVLTMDDVVVNDQCFDQVIMDWIDELQQEEILEISQRWITTQNFLTTRMQGLERVGESSLTIEPLEETDHA